MARFQVVEVRESAGQGAEVYILDTRQTHSEDRPNVYVKPMYGVDANEVAAALNFWWDAND